jgi:uncharacterized protein
LKPQVLFSLHDITPFHQARIERAEALFQVWGIPHIAYLFVPKYHGQNDAGTHPGFKDFCRSARSFQVDWLLHGYYHLETDDASLSATDPARPTARIEPSNMEKEKGEPFGQWWKRTFMTAGEGEFLALDEAESLRRLALGQERFEACLGYRADAFIPPAWLHSEGLFAWLKKAGFAYSENHQGLRLLRKGQKGHVVPSPVVTWATRTWLRRKGSLVVCPALAWWHQAATPLRIAMHPFDFDYPETVANIEKVVRRALAERETVGWRLFDST